MSVGAFGFDISNSKRYPGYIGEKLTLSGNKTREKLTQLINGIIKELQDETI